MMDKKTFKKAIAAPLESESFVKKGQSWYLDGRDAVIVFNLQKSDWEERYYINIGIWLKALGKPNFPEENQCHLSHRVERLFREDRELINESTSLEKSNIKLLAELSEFIKIRLVPFLRDCTDESKLRDFVATGRFRSGFIIKEARLYLGAK